MKWIRHLYLLVDIKHNRRYCSRRNIHYTRYNQKANTKKKWFCGIFSSIFWLQKFRQGLSYRSFMCILFKFRERMYQYVCLESRAMLDPVLFYFLNFKQRYKLSEPKAKILYYSIFVIRNYILLYLEKDWKTSPHIPTYITKWATSRNY